MLVVREIKQAVRTIAKVKRKVRLASGLDANNNLSQEAMVRGWQCLSLFAEQLQDIPRDNIRIVGTATLRLANNVEVFLEKAEQILNHKIDIISGEQEAATIYQGVAYTSCGQGNRLVIDIGGASTELIIGAEKQAQLLNSLDLGCVTWLNRYFADQQLNLHNFDQAIAGAKQVIDKVSNEYLSLGWQTCIGASGTVQALQETLKAQGLSEQITLAKLQEIKLQCIACDTMPQLRIKGLAAERLAVFPSGLAILIALFEQLNIDSMTLAGGALREGLVYSMIGDSDYLEVRERTLQSLTRRYQIDATQGQYVKDTAEYLLNQLQQQGIDFTDSARVMLASAASVYEIGLCIEYKKSPQHAAYIIDNIDLPGFTQAQQTLLSALLINQRGRLNLARLQSQNAIPVEQSILLVRLLRLAIILCMRRTLGSIPELSLQLNQQQLTLTFPDQWQQEHALRAAELAIEAQLQTDAGYPVIVKEVG